MTWSGLCHDLSVLDKAKMRALLREVYPTAPTGKISNNLGQIWAFSHLIKPADWIALPSKQKAAIHIAEATGTYRFHPKGPDPLYHSIAVKWLETDIPRSNFDQDILYSLGAFMTICQVYRNDAEARVRAMATNGWKSKLVSATLVAEASEEDELPVETPANLEQIARDQIAKFILARFKGHNMARLIDALLQAQGYTTYMSPPGPDKGIDILAAPGLLGFGSPRICVQVKTGQSPLERTVLDQLIGVMQKVQAEQGLLVSWGGFKSSIDQEEASQFFRVRLWDQDDVIDQLLTHYDQLSDDLRAELPLKRFWTIAETEDESE